MGSHATTELRTDRAKNYAKDQVKCLDPRSKPIATREGTYKNEPKIFLPQGTKGWGSRGLILEPINQPKAGIRSRQPPKIFLGGGLGADCWASGVPGQTLSLKLLANPRAAIGHHRAKGQGIHWNYWFYCAGRGGTNASSWEMVKGGEAVRKGPVVVETEAGNSSNNNEPALPRYNKMTIWGVDREVIPNFQFLNLWSPIVKKLQQRAI